MSERLCQDEDTVACLVAAKTRISSKVFSNSIVVTQCRQKRRKMRQKQPNLFLPSPLSCMAIIPFNVYNTIAQFITPQQPSVQLHYKRSISSHLSSNIIWLHGEFSRQLSKLLIDAKKGVLPKDNVCNTKFADVSVCM